MSQDSTLHCPDCNNLCSSRQSSTDRRLKIELQYTDKKHDIDLSLNLTSPIKITIRKITKELLEFLCLDDISSEHVRLIGYNRDGGYHPLNIKNQETTLEELDMTDGCILFFEPTSNAPPPKTCRLTIIGPDEIKKIDYKWCTAKTTLGMLFEYVIEQFSLQQVEHQRIHLLTLLCELECFSHPDERLSLFNLHDGMSVYVQIIPSLSETTIDKTKNVHVLCTCRKIQFNLDISNEATIGDLKNKIERRFEDRQIIEFELYNDANDELESDDRNRSLQSLKVQPGETIYARFRLTTPNTQVASSNTKPKYGMVNIICNFSFNDPEAFRISLTSTVNQVIEKVDDYIRGRQLIISEMYSNNIHIDFKNQPERCLADLGFNDDDIINVIFNDKISTNSSIVSKQISSLPKTNKPLKTARIKKVPIGLDNLDNSACMSSILQCLAHVPQLTNQFLKDIDQAQMDDDEGEDEDWNPYDKVGEVTGAYAELLWYLWRDEEDEVYDSCETNRMKETIGAKDTRFITNDQQDAQEFITFFLDIIHKELKKKNNNQTDTIISELFFSKLLSTITCTACNREESRTQQISFLSLPLNRQERKFHIHYIPKNGKDVHTSVDVSMNGRVENVVDEFSHRFSRPSIFYRMLPMLPDAELSMHTPLSEVHTHELILMEQEDKIRTTRPERLKLPEKKCTLEDCLKDYFSPEALQDGWTCQQEKCKKNSIAMKQVKLCQSPPVLIIELQRFLHKDSLRQKNEARVEFPITGLNLNKILPSLQEEAIYDLVAVVNHIGSVYNGFYTACAQHSIENKKEWYKFEDSFVTYIEPDDYEYDIISKNACLLFYIKRIIETDV